MERDDDMPGKILIPINTEQSVDKLLNELKFLNPLLLNSHITLLYVQTLVYNTAVGLDAVVVTPEVEPEGLRILERGRESLEKMKLCCQTALKTGNPVQEIVQYAAKERIDLIILCRREQGLLESLLFSNMSDELIEKAATNILVVK